MLRRLLPLAGAVLLLPAAALGDGGYRPEVPGPGEEDGFRWNVATGAYRFAAHHLTAFDLDRDGTGSPLDTWAEHRVRWSPSMTWGPVRIMVELDVVEGHLLGATEDLSSEYRRLDRRAEYDGRDFSNLLLREAFLEYRSPVGLLKIGQMTSSYGAGILSNRGIDDDDRFGLRRHGDVVDRFLLATTPFLPATGPKTWGEHLTLVLAGDLVFRDENAVLLDGDRAWMANAGVFYRHPRWTNGFVFTWRTQKDDDGDSLLAYAFNLNGNNRLALTLDAAGGPDLELTLDYELAWITGNTTRFQQIGSEDGLDLLAFGGMGRLGVASEATGLTGEVEIGYASGDNDPYDDTSHAFFFDPDYDVGLIFFDEMLPLITARAAEISADPAHLNVAPKGLDLVPTQGRVTNAFYVFPQLRWRTPWNLGAHIEKIQVMAGGLVITTPAALAHPYYTFENGGVPANHLGRETSSAYAGTELLAGVRAKLWAWPDHAGFDLRLDQSCFLPGSALKDPAGDTSHPVWKTLASVALRWR